MPYMVWPGTRDWIAQRARIGPILTGLKKKKKKEFLVIFYYTHRSVTCPGILRKASKKKLIGTDAETCSQALSQAQEIPRKKGKKDWRNPRNPEHQENMAYRLN